MGVPSLRSLALLEHPLGAGPRAPRGTEPLPAGGEPLRSACRARSLDAHKRQNRWQLPRGKRRSRASSLKELHQPGDPEMGESQAAAYGGAPRQPRVPRSQHTAGPRQVAPGARPGPAAGGDRPEPSAAARPLRGSSRRPPPGPRTPPRGRQWAPRPLLTEQAMISLRV